ncbi:MAG: arginine--tRNA ligase, partial [Patescibacteria group bacterium]
EILNEINKLGDKYGESDVNENKIALIDYSSPNIAKPMGVGHLRSTIIGQALANIYHKTGFSVIKDNHLGDWGTQFGKLIYAYQKWGDKEKISKNPIKELNDLYVKFNKEAEKNPELDEKAREFFQKLERGDKRLVNLWREFSKLSVKEFNKIYKKLGVDFDIYIGESYFSSEADKEVKEALKKGIARKDSATGAVIVDSLDVPSFLLQKQDGSTLYITRDLAALRFRVKTFKPDVILYVVGQEQTLNFRQLFELSKALDILDKVQAKHTGFGLVLAGEEKMSTRKGTLIELKELISQSVAKSKKILLEKNPDINKKELKEISEIIGVGAIIYNDLRQSRSKNISFNWERMLNFEGGSAVYLQYTYARINSILKKVKSTQLKKTSNIIFEKDIEFLIAKKLMFYSIIINNAQKFDFPHLIATYLEELAQIFNSFYNNVSIIETKDKNLRQSRLILIKSVAQVIKNGLELLNIKVAERI